MPESIILIIDDDLDDQDLLVEALNEIDDTLICYKSDNGQEGIKSLQSNLIPRPHLIFVDINMPKVDGRQFLEQIKKDAILKDIPVVIYSTTHDEVEHKKLIKSGAAFFFKKPSNFNDLKKNLQELLETYLYKAS